VTSVRTVLTSSGEHAANLVRHEELGIRVPPERQLGRPHLRLAERRPVCGRRALLVRRGVGDNRAHADQRRTGLLEDRRLDRRRQRVKVVGVLDRDRVPAIRPEARCDVLAGEAQRRVAVDRDPVVVVEAHEPAEAEVTGQRCRLRRHSLHQVPVGAEREHPVIDHLPAVALAQEPLSQRHADGVAESLAERSGRRLDPGRQPMLRMPGRARSPSAEALDLGQRKVVAGQMQNAVEQHRTVPGREDEPIPVRPPRIRRVVTQEAGVEEVRHRGHRHRQPGMPGAGLLHRVHAQHADGVHAQPLERRIHTGRRARRNPRAHPGTATTVGVRVPSPPRATAALAVTR